ncbi:hypothetical protein PV11_00738 [Exophiala sideris]|uniref:Uncharacterized protein n=1 Tax=Exophiala sideris TaxID=1016849 RepID=A0A0D1YQL2_9EURO|nr:hypothetical protein PV11_00738 [Exophiala sideris]
MGDYLYRGPAHATVNTGGIDDDRGNPFVEGNNIDVCNQYHQDLYDTLNANAKGRYSKMLKLVRAQQLMVARDPNDLTQFPFANDWCAWAPQTERQKTRDGCVAYLHSAKRIPLRMAAPLNQWTTPSQPTQGVQFTSVDEVVQSSERIPGRGSTCSATVTTEKLLDMASKLKAHASPVAQTGPRQSNAPHLLICSPDGKR